MAESTGTDAAPRRILIPVDGSENSERAYEYAKDNYYRQGDRFLMVHAVEPPSLPSFSIGAGMTIPAAEWAEIIQETNKKAAKLEKHWTKILYNDGIPYDYFNVMSRKAGDGIIDVAEEKDADVIIMGNRGLGTVRRTLLGSVSDHVLHHGRIPVTVVPPPK